MLGRSSRSRSFFKKLVVNGVSNSKTAIRHDCLMRLYDADAELKAISQELDSFDGKKDPVRCNLLVNQLRTAQDKVISLLFQLMDECNCERASRDYRMKFPDEILLSEGSESLNGQIWFGAECLSAGSNILNHTKESTMLRPMAKTLTTHLDSLRNDLRDLVLEGDGATRINHALIKKMVAFDQIFASFEYQYVRTMLPIRSVAEIEKLQEVAVLFSETLIDCVRRGLTKQEDIDEFQPIVMIAIPRLSIVRGLLYRHDNPIYTRHKSHMCSLFQPFHGPLHSIRKLLRALSPHHLLCLERMLANDQTATDDPLGLMLTASCMAQGTSSDGKSTQESGVLVQNNSFPETNENIEPGTSNHQYPNALNRGLEYPVGHKRLSNVELSQINSAMHCTANDQPRSPSCCLDAPQPPPPPSSSKVDPSSASSTSTSPSQSSSVSSSSLECNRSNEQSLSRCPANSLDNTECDKNRCLSQVENDPQLDSLIAEFRPRIDSQEPQSTSNSPNHYQSTLEDEPIDLSTTRVRKEDEKPEKPESISKDTTSSPSECISLVEKCGKEQALDNKQANLDQELYQKQAQKLLHRLFVAISGVADQLQSNFASDLRFILRHVFNTEEESTLSDCDLDPDDADYDNEDESQFEHDDSDRSSSEIPVEQALEAHEEANLIDLGSACSVDNPFENDPRYMQPTTGQTPASISNSMNQSLLTSGNRLIRSESLNDRRISSSRRQCLRRDDDSGGDYVRDVDLTRITNDPIYGEATHSPNDLSIMDDHRHRHQLVQQHLQSISTRAIRSSSRSHRRDRQQPTTESGSVATSGRSRGNHGNEHHHRQHDTRRHRPSPPVWVADHLVIACTSCSAQFTWLRRRHHCRACGQIFCADCSKFTRNLNHWGYNGPVRVCEVCSTRRIDLME